MVTKKRNLSAEFSKILESHGITDDLLVGQLTGVVEVLYAKRGRESKKKADPRSQPLVVKYQTHIGYPLANFGMEMKWADWLFSHGYSEEQIFACYDDMKRGWWYDKKIGLNNVADKIGAFVQNNSRLFSSQRDTPASQEVKRKARETMDAIFGGDDVQR